MKKKPVFKKLYCFLVFVLNSLLFFIAFSGSAKAQDQITSAAKYDKKVTCKIQVNNKTYEVTPNQIGYFKRITNIPPMAAVSIEITYPLGLPEEKVLISVQDGGELDNGKGIKVGQLDNQNKLSFSFKVTDNPGLYTVNVKKGNDFNVVRLWVGAEPLPAKQ